MTIPTQSEFDDYILLAKQVPGALEFSKFRSELSDDLGNLEALAPALFRSVWQRREELLASLQKHPVIIWLKSEPGYRRAFSKMFGKNLRKDDPEAFVQRQTKWLLTRERNAKGFFWINFAYFVRLRFAPIEYGWTSKVVEALHEYMFVDHDARHLVRAEAEKQINKVRSLLEKLRPFVVDEFGDGDLKWVETKVERWSERAKARPERDQQNKAEHRLARRLALLNQRFDAKRSMKMTVVSELMAISVVERQFDIRTLYTISKELAEKAKKDRENFMAEKEERKESDVMKKQLKEQTERRQLQEATR